MSKEPVYQINYDDQEQMKDIERFINQQYALIEQKKELNLKKNFRFDYEVNMLFNIGMFDPPKKYMHLQDKARCLYSYVIYQMVKNKANKEALDVIVDGFNTFAGRN